LIGTAGAKALQAVVGRERPLSGRSRAQRQYP
jgi:hypothetical protein